MFKKISTKEYYKDDGMNASTLKAWYTDPQIARKERGKDTFWRAMAFGSLAHAVVVEGLENEDGNPFYEVYQKGAGERARAKAIEERGLIPIGDKELESVMLMRQTMEQNHPDIFKHLCKDYGVYEHSAVWWSDLSGLVNRRKWKARYDIVEDRGSNVMIWDYKTTTNGLTDYAIYETMNDYNYDMQAALYLDGISQIMNKPATFGFIFQEKTEPFTAREVIIGDKLIRQGREKIKKAIFNIEHNKPYKWSIWDSKTKSWSNPPILIDRIKGDTIATQDFIPVGMDGNQPPLAEQQQIPTGKKENN